MRKYYSGKLIIINIYILIKILVQFFDCKIPERVLLTGAISKCKRFSKVSHLCEAKKCGLSLLAIFSFLVLSNGPDKKERTKTQ